MARKARAEVDAAGKVFSVLLGCAGGEERRVEAEVAAAAR